MVPVANARRRRTVGRPRAPRLRWWREVLYILAFYGVYSLIRNKGVNPDAVGTARDHATQVIDLERRLGSFHEESIQQWFLRWPDFIKFWNVYYGTAHFIVTVVALVLLFRRMSARYPLWRNTLACTTGLALLGFAFYPLMPPRLLPDSFGFLDTLKEVGGLWNFDSGPVAKVSNQYAAMPSLHFAWSSWCAFVLYPAVRRRWAKALMVAYPLTTLFAIVVTANHYWLDAAGGGATLGAGFLLGRGLTRFLARRGLQPVPAPATEPDVDLSGDLTLTPEDEVVAGAEAIEPETEPEPVEPPEAEPESGPEPGSEAKWAGRPRPRVRSTRRRFRRQLRRQHRNPDGAG